jgi:hypothetical protein
MVCISSEEPVQRRRGPYRGIGQLASTEDEGLGSYDSAGGGKMT